jgi:nucleoside-diphosphate-sugar epimerase
MSVMLTGGAGFVGLNMAEQLLAAGEHVVTYGLEAPPEQFLTELTGCPGRLSVEIGDVRDRDALLRAMREHEVGRLVHGAAVTAGPQRELVAADEIAAVNLGGTIEVLEAAVAHGIARVVHLSSGSVYGATADTPGSLDEIVDSPVPDSLYGITKYAAERTALRYRSTRGLDLVVARLGVVFGRWEYATGKRDTLSIPLQLMRMAEKNEPVKIPDDLPDDWVYATDVAAAVVGLLTCQAFDGTVFHVASGRRWSIIDWCARLRDTFPNFTYEFVRDKSMANVGRETPNRRSPFSIERLRNQLGYEPRFMAPEAMADYLIWWHAAQSG